MVMRRKRMLMLLATMKRRMVTMAAIFRTRMRMRIMLGW